MVPQRKVKKPWKNKKKYFETLWGRPFREKSKTVEKPTKKPKKQKKKKNNILRLLPNLFHFQDLWKISFLFFVFFCFF